MANALLDRAEAVGPASRRLFSGPGTNTTKRRSTRPPEYKRNGENVMKTFVSMFALALALAFTGLAFAGDVTTAKNPADCEKAGGAWDAQTGVCSEKKM